MEYTDRLEHAGAKDKAKRTFQQIKDICAMLSGIVVALDPAIGQQILESNDFARHSGFFQSILEIARRHKIRNPEKMRSIYGKLIYMLQDSQSEDVQEYLEFSMVAPIQTSYKYLEDRGALECLRDKYMPLATGEILAEGKERPEIDKALRWKDQALAYIAKKICVGQNI